MKKILELFIKVIKGLSKENKKSEVYLEINSSESGDIFKLIDVCCEVIDNPKFRPHGSVTYCNQAVQFVAGRMGCTQFTSMMANQIVDSIKASTDWTLISISEAQKYANKGHLVIAGIKAHPHGHVVVIRPGQMGVSGKWGMKVPKIINVGQENFIGKGLSWAFRDKPDVFVWKKGGKK